MNLVRRIAYISLSLLAIGVAEAFAQELQLISRDVSQPASTSAVDVLRGTVIRAEALGDSSVVIFPAPQSTDVRELRAAIIDRSGVVTQLAASQWVAASQRATSDLGQIYSAALSPDGQRLAVVIGWIPPTGGSRNGIAWLDRDPRAAKEVWHLTRVTTAPDAIREPMWVSPNQLVVVAFRPDETGRTGANYLRVVNADGTDSDEVPLTEPVSPRSLAANDQLTIRLTTAGPNSLCAYDGMSNSVSFFSVQIGSRSVNLMLKSRRNLPAAAELAKVGPRITTLKAFPDERVIVVRNALLADGKPAAVATLYPPSGDPRSIEIGSPWNAAYFSNGELVGIRTDATGMVLMDSVVLKSQ